MRTLVAFFVLATLLAGCDRSAPPGAPPDPLPPNGNARFTDGDGLDRTAFRPIGVIHYGERVEDTLAPAEALVGYEFAGGGGDLPVLILDVRGGATASMALYGPRGDNGLWDRPLAAIDGTGALRLPPVELPADGHYFVLLRRLAGASATFALQLSCPDCAAPVCADVEPCDLFCEQGYAAGDDGCRLCGCEEARCEGPEDCLGGQICADGRCRPAPGCDEQCVGEPARPVCGVDGTTHPNACVAACRGVEVAAEGRCVEAGCRGDGDCAPPLRCLDGVCACDCPRINDPVCGVSGVTHTNLCVLDCAGDTLAYRGECDRIPPPRACGAGAPCPDGQLCVGAGEDGEGVCALTCPVRDPAICGRRATCADLGLGERGACLPACGFDGMGCPEVLSCLPDQRGRLACFPCDCADDDGGPVCADGRHGFDSACAARCAGYSDDRLRAGACGELMFDCSMCRDLWSPVCAEGVLYSSGCDVLCAGGRPGPGDRVEQCYAVSPRIPCRDDGGCPAEACDGWACEGPGCPPLSDDARCFVDFGLCGCVEGSCGYRGRRGDVQLMECLDRARGG